MTSRSVGKFSQINEEYHKLTMEFISEKELLKDTSKGTFAAAACSTLYELFKKINLGKSNSFCDLGSGDGRVVAVASVFTTATGIEYEKSLVELSNKIVAKLQLSHCFFIEGDYLLQDLSRYSVLFINPDGPLYKLEKKLRDSKFKGILVVFNTLYEPLNLVKKDEMFIDMMKIGIYKV